MISPIPPFDVCSDNIQAERAFGKCRLPEATTTITEIFDRHLSRRPSP
jgi:hypothetical protein